MKSVGQIDKGFYYNGVFLFSSVFEIGQPFSEIV